MTQFLRINQNGKALCHIIVGAGFAVYNSIESRRLPRSHPAEKITEEPRWSLINKINIYISIRAGPLLRPTPISLSLSLKVTLSRSFPRVPNHSHSPLDYTVRIDMAVDGVRLRSGHSISHDRVLLSEAYHGCQHTISINHIMLRCSS